MFRIMRSRSRGKYLITRSKVKSFFVLYKPVAEKEIWDFKKTKTQEATLHPLQPGTEYMVRIATVLVNRSMQVEWLGFSLLQVRN